MSRIIIKNCTLVPMVGMENPWFKGDLVIAGDRIESVGPEVQGTPQDKIIDGEGRVAMPGLVNAHTHAAMTLFRGYADDLPLMEWLSQKIWPAEDRLKGEDVYWGTMLAIVEMIRSGTTAFADMYFFMDDAARGVEESGIRASLSRGLIGVAPTGEGALAESRRFIKAWNGAAEGRITTMLGPHAPYTCPPAYLEKVLETAVELQVGMHIHLSETRTEVEDIVKQYGKTPIQLMEEVGLFRQPVLAAHCVHPTPEELDILASRGVKVAHNPESNMKLASGIAPVKAMLDKGITVALGTDGASSNNNLDMIEEMRAAALLQKVSTGDPTALPAYQALEMATVNGAQALGLSQAGRLQPGMKADVILLNFQQAHLYPKHDVLAHLVYASRSADVETVIVDGRILMEKGVLLTLDEEKILHESERTRQRLFSS